MTLKFVFTSPAALLCKYGPTGATEIDAAVRRWIDADAARGITTRQVDAPNGTGSPAAFKATLDAALEGQTVDYIAILGGPDIVPHVELINPLHDEQGDVDATAPGDLPYACEQQYSRSISDFVGPTRVVGRLPDLTGAREPSYLIGLIESAIAHQPSTSITRYFGLSADVWRQSTRQALTTLFGHAEWLAVAPPKGPEFADEVLRAPLHLINCHGAPADPYFYGQRDGDFPIALASDKLDAVQAGTVAAMECCYGGELYDPALTGGVMSIAQRYLARRSAGVVASSTIAYGPAVGNAQADLLCVYFLQSVLAGASIGRAFLEARLKYIRNCRVLTPVDLKTISQFMLLGDPSLVPLANAIKALPTTATRRRRRIHLRELGITLPSSVAVTQRLPRPAVPPRVEALIKSELRKMLPRLARDLARSTYLVRQSADRSAKSFVLPTRVHVALANVGPRSLAGLIAVESRDTVDLQRIYSR